MIASDLIALYHDTVAALSAESLTRDALLRSAPRPAPGGKLRVFGLGKAAPAMARGAAAALGAVEGTVATNAPGALPSGLDLVLGSHPIPDSRSEAAGRALLDAAAACETADAAVFLISGGGSAVAAVPADGLTLQDKVEATRSLLRSGADIEEMNAVRKHLSSLKGGRLAAACRAGSVEALVLCDIPSARLDAVASGPTSADPTRFADCLEIVRRHGVALPEAARTRIERGAAGGLEETLKPGDARVDRVRSTLLATPADLSRVARRLALARGVPVAPLAPPFTGTVEALAAQLSARAAAVRAPLLFALSGEPTVRVPRGAGAGGRMQHLALLLARALAGRRFVALCAGSDGRDGESAHAGAVVDGGSAQRAAEAGVDLDAALARFESANACRAIGAALPAFASDTNLCDLVLLHVEA